MLIGLLAVVISLFGSDALTGGSQLALLAATALCISISMLCYRVPWSVFEERLKQTIGSVSVTIVMLLLIGMMAGTWMISGVVPTLIYYGIQFMSPQFFLVSACVICSLVSVLSGSSWTTIATIGVALLGIGNALGVSPAWMAGAIISGAYFGDKMSPLSDTTILASSATGTDLFRHIRYMTLTTIPSITLTLIIFFIAGFGTESRTALHISQYTDGLSSTFHISLWTLLVPILTALLIWRRVPSLITLFTSAVMAGLMAVILQPHLLDGIGTGSVVRGLFITCFGSTQVETGYTPLNDLIATRGMSGMLDTIWLILCAMCFGSAMVASRMIDSLTSLLLRHVRSRLGIVSSTVGTGIFLNTATGDQFISIVLTADMFRDVYRREGYESRLLSRTTEDAATVTSVLIPWNTCGLTQSTVLGVPTLVYLPYCFFNLLSPLTTMVVAAIGWRIRRKQ